MLVSWSAGFLDLLPDRSRRASGQGGAPAAKRGRTAPCLARAVGDVLPNRALNRVIWHAVKGGAFVLNGTRSCAAQLVSYLATSWHEPYRHADKLEALGRRRARRMASWPFRCGGGYPAPQVVPAPTRSANSCPMAPATAVARRARPWDVAAHRGVRSWRFRSLGAALCHGRSTSALTNVVRQHAIRGTGGRA